MTRVHDILVVGEKSAWPNVMESVATPAGMRFICSSSLEEGVEMLRLYNEAVDAVVVDVSPSRPSETADTLCSTIRTISPSIPVFILGGVGSTGSIERPGLRPSEFVIPENAGPEQILTHLCQVLGNGVSEELPSAPVSSALVRVVELPVTRGSSANYVAQFAFKLHSCFVARNETEEHDAQSAALRWHNDLLTMVSLLDADIRLSIRMFSNPAHKDNSKRLTLWLSADVYAQTGSAAKANAEKAALQLGNFLTRDASCYSGIYGFVPVRSRRQLKKCLQPFKPAAMLEFRQRSISVNPGPVATTTDGSNGIRIASPARPSQLRTLQRLTDVMSHQRGDVMLEIIAQPAKLTPYEIELLRYARTNLWIQESSLTYRELQTLSFELDELLQSAAQTYMMQFRLWSGTSTIPESLISTVSREYYLPVSGIMHLPQNHNYGECAETDAEGNRLASIVPSGCAIELFRLPLPTRIPLCNIAPSHPVFDYIPHRLPPTGPVLGTKTVGEETVEIRVSPEDLRRHVYVIGQTGTGKSTLLRSMIMERIESGNGLCLIDPHGDLLSGIVSHLTKRDRARVRVFDPSDVSHPLGLNMLEYDPAHPEQKTLLVNQMISIFDMLYDLRVTGGPIFEQYMRNAMLLVMDDPENQGTLVSVTRVFQESEYRKGLVDRCKNDLVRAFWLEAMRTRGEGGLEYLSPYITSKLNQFVSNDYIYPIISRKKSGLDFRALIDSNSIFLVKLSKGKLGEIGVKLLGLILFARILLAALSRDDVQENKRPDFSLFVDEFQNFTSESVAQMLSEARKYRLNLVLANQTLGQLRSSILESVLGNVGSIVLFRPGINDFERITPYVDPPFQREDVLNLPNHAAIGRLLAQGVPLPPFVFNTINPSVRRR